jgi:hypothetical protein
MGRSDRDPSTAGLGILAAGVGLCCGVPLLLGTGLAVGGAGLVLGSALLVAVGVGLGGWAMYRRRQRANCDLDDADADLAAQPDQNS